MKAYVIYYVIKRNGHAELKHAEIEAQNKKTAFAEVERLAQEKYGRHAFSKTTEAPVAGKHGVEWRGMIYTKARFDYLW